MSGQTLTALFIVGVIAAVVCFDLAVNAWIGNEATISRLTLDTANRYRGFAILVAFAVGVLFGHLFLPQHVTVTK